MTEKIEIASKYEAYTVYRTHPYYNSNIYVLLSDTYLFNRRLTGDG